MKLTYSKEGLKQICLKYQVDYLGVSRGDNKRGSDIDLLVRFSPANNGGLFELSAMRDDLQKLLHRKVDLLTEGFLSKYFKDEVISEAKTIYS